jgi:hypothetical protein
MPCSIYLLNEHYTELASKMMIAIAITELIAAIGSMYIANMNRNAFARNSHHDRVDNEENNRHVCIVQKHVSVDQKYVCIDKKHRSSDYPQEEIILSSPGLSQTKHDIFDTYQHILTTKKSYNEVRTKADDNDRLDFIEIIKSLYETFNMVKYYISDNPENISLDNRKLWPLRHWIYSELKM